MKKVFAVLGIFCITNLFSDYNEEGYPSNSSWQADVKFNVLYLQPHSTNLHYAAEADPLPLPTPNWKIHEIKPQYHFGFDLGVKAISNCRCAYAEIEYSHLYAKDSAHKAVFETNMLGPFFEIGPDADQYKIAKGHVKFHYDTMSILGGVYTDFGNCFHANFFAGVDILRIKQDLVSFYSDYEHTTTRKISAPSKFFGAGPVLGMDFTYDIWDGLQLSGGSSAALLVGTVKNHTEYDSVSPELATLPVPILPPNKQSTRGHSKTQVVPAFEGKLGLTYSMNVCNCAIDFNAGYEVRVYFNAIQSTDMGSEVINILPNYDTVGVYARTFQRNLSNFALAGPYVGFNIVF